MENKELEEIMKNMFLDDVPATDGVGDGHSHGSSVGF
jgi:hypothetical protein